MKVLLYFEGQKLIANSGIGHAMHHQMKALVANDVEYTLDPNDDYDVLHINTYGINSWKVIRDAKRKHKPVIYHAHSTEEDFRNSFIGSNLIAPLYRRYLVSLYRQADVLITPTPYSKKLIAGYGLKQPIYPISNGIELMKYEPKLEKEQAFRTHFNLDDDTKVVISVGLLFARKGIVDFVEIARLNPEIKFIWFGHINLAAIPANIRRIVKEDHPDNVIFPGYITGDVIEGAYSGANAFLFPSYEETEGIVVLEALASQQNVIVRDIPVYDGWLYDQQNVLKANDIPSFNQQLQRALTTDMRTIVQAGYKTATDRDLKVVGAQLKQVYEQVLRDKSQLVK